LSIDLAALRHARELPTLKTTVFPRFIVSWSTRFDVTQGHPISCFSSNLLTILRWAQGPRADVDIAIPAYEGSRATAMYNRPTHATELSFNCIATKSAVIPSYVYVRLSFLQDPYLPTDCSSEPILQPIGLCPASVPSMKSGHFPSVPYSRPLHVACFNRKPYRHLSW
jgi:hypothetical protein